jgi:hypothetical protein
MSDTPIFELVDKLPESNMTTHVLNALDFVIPGEWQNTVGFEETIRQVTGETDQEWIQKVGERAIHLYNDKSQGYQRAVWLYQTVDTTDKALAAAVFADKIGEKVGFLSFLSKITPKADHSQFLDLSLKLVVELVAFCQINGIPGDSIGDFVKSLGDYSGESLMRMTALVCVDGLIPLGPDFLEKTLSSLKEMQPSDLEENKTFDRVREDIPGEDTGGQLHFIQQSFAAVEGWMSSFVEEHDLTPEKVSNQLVKYVDIADDKLDYLGAFLDMTTNYYEHTGIQTVAQRLIRRAASEV